MFRKLFLLFVFFAINAVYAGSYEDALQKKDKVFLYFYSPTCSSCRAFDSVYDSIKKDNQDYEFVKVNVETRYGSRLLYKFKGRYIPYIILTDSKKNKSVNVNHTCVMNDVCLMRAMKSFKG